MWLTPCSSSSSSTRSASACVDAAERGGAEDRARAVVAGAAEGRGGDHATTLVHRPESRVRAIGARARSGYESGCSPDVGTAWRRHAPSMPSSGGHAIWWTVEAADEDAALALLPSYVAERTAVSQVSEVLIP